MLTHFLSFASVEAVLWRLFDPARFESAAAEAAAARAGPDAPPKRLLLSPGPAAAHPALAAALATMDDYFGDFQAREGLARAL